MPDLTPLDLEELKRKAERCTTGDPWYKEEDLLGRQSFGQFLTQDRAFIAAANPATVLALINQIEGMRAALKPFSLAMATLSSRWLDHETQWNDALPRPITVGELRKARQALSTEDRRGDQ